MINQKTTKIFKPSNRENFTVDCENKIFGKIIVEIADILRGKNSPTFSYQTVSNNFVEIINWKKVKFSGNKFNDKMYYRHSGYIGNLRSENLKSMWEKDPKVVFIHAIKGMLPKNRLRDIFIKRISFKDENAN
ncbi:MAG: large subunit ribosomal protein L13 [Candidatus Berkelbacteria bacterium Licking1014_85]|uniref:50S ribosomal protein L13 n=1 Tax=Candidatus Berkelbacteria bacterium Licking1014_85 TaxID=2017148 RepID=A0A554LLU6_9BACT|nr:MAG: large subunit ribosomal protein L13 [Candidatus Berkelbacteria bacterium Licking1014_85]